MTTLEWIASIAESPGFDALIKYLITLLGSFTMYLYSFSKGFEGSITVLKRLFPSKKKVFYDRMDFLLVIFLGSAIGSIFFQPQDSLQALAAGFGWVGAINIMLNNKEGGDDNG